MNLRIIFYVITSGFLFFSCKKKTNEISDKNYRIVGNIQKDSVWNGEMRFYDLKSKKLVAMRTYKDGILNGPSLRYNDKGRIIDSVSYILNQKMGYNYVYNDSGQILQKVNFFYGRQMGESYMYENDTISEYSFQNFENKLLYYYSFDSKSGKEHFADDSYLANSSTNECVVDGVDGVNIFTYLVMPPKLKLTHRIYKYDSINHIIDSFTIPHKTFYFEKFFPVNNNKESFAVYIYKYDSIKNKETVIINKIKTQFP